METKLVRTVPANIPVKVTSIGSTILDIHGLTEVVRACLLTLSKGETTVYMSKAGVYKVIYNITLKRLKDTRVFYPGLSQGILETVVDSLTEFTFEEDESKEYDFLCAQKVNGLEYDTARFNALKAKYGC